MASINENFIVSLKGKDFVTYEGLLDLGHQKGLVSIEVELLQIPSKDNDMIAIAKATAKTDKETFVDIGDAGPRSVNNMIGPHIIRMASTRAKARALRDLTNVGMTAVEEIIEEDTNPKHFNYSNSNSNQETDLKCSECSAEITSGASKVSIGKYGKELCPPCQKNQEDNK